TTSPGPPRLSVRAWPPKTRRAPRPGSSSARLTKRPSASKLSSPSASAKTRPSGSCTRRACLRLTAKSCSCRSQSAPRPMTSSPLSTVRVRTISPPEARWVTWRRVKLIDRASPVEEDADDVGRKRRQQRQGRRHVHLQPDLQDRPKPHVPPRPGQHLG